MKSVSKSWAIRMVKARQSGYQKSFFFERRNSKCRALDGFVKDLCIRIDKLIRRVSNGSGTAVKN